MADHRSGRPILVAVALVALTALAACTNDSAPAKGERPASAADQRANLTVLKDADLPSGWKVVPARSRLDGPPGKPIYCGISAEPAPIREGRLGYYEQASTGRAVLAYDMVGTSQTAGDVLDALIKVAPDCREEGRTLTVVSDSPAVGGQSVAWDTVSDTGARSRVLVFRADDTVVALIAFGATSVPVTEQAAIARTIENRLS